MNRFAFAAMAAILFAARICGADDADGTAFFERKIRPLLVEHCYPCHSESAGEQQGGLLLDRPGGWLGGGTMGKAVVPGELDASLLITAVRYQRDDLQMPPDGPLMVDQVRSLQEWVRRGAPAPDSDLGETEFSRLGDQDYLRSQAEHHWSFQPLGVALPPPTADPVWNRNPIDRFVWHRLNGQAMTPSPPADATALINRLSYDITGLPPTFDEIESFAHQYQQDGQQAIDRRVDQLLLSPAYGQHIGRMWLDVARYADTDSFYRPDTRTPHYFPFAFTYRDYVIDALNRDTPYDQFLNQQLAADLQGYSEHDPEIAALGFFGVGPHANRSQSEALDDWIDLTTRGLMGVTAACARCHDHKFEPVPTTDYYALRGIFNALNRVGSLDEARQPEVPGYHRSAAEVADYQRQRAKIDAKINAVGNKKAGGNNRSVAEKIRETELAQLLLFHPGAPARAMIVTDKAKAPPSHVFVRGDATSPGEQVPRRFLSILDRSGQPFDGPGSGRLELAQRITDPANPLTARVMVNRIWGHLIGSYLVATPSDFGLQGGRPTHPQLLDWLADDFIRHDWSIKHLVRTILSSQTYRQSSRHRADMARLDPENRLLWRGQRRHLSIESIRDSVLAVSGGLDREQGGHPGKLWDDQYTPRRAVYGFINRFNLDPTLRAFDFPTPMQTQPKRDESIVAPQVLFLMNSSFVIDRASGLTESPGFTACQSDSDRIAYLFRSVLRRLPTSRETERVEKFVQTQQRLKSSPRLIDSPWPLVAQSLMMSNEFQYVD